MELSFEVYSKNYEELPIIAYVEYLKFCYENTNKISQLKKLLTLTTSLTEDDLNKLDLKSFYKILEEIKDLLSDPPFKEINSFNYNNTNYYVNYNVESFSIAQFQDLSYFDTEYNMFDKIIPTVSLLLSTSLEELSNNTSQYNGNEKINRINIIESMPTSIINSIAFTYLKKKMNLQLTLIEYGMLEKQMIQMLKQIKEKTYFNQVEEIETAH